MPDLPLLLNELLDLSVALLLAPGNHLVRMITLIAPDFLHAHPDKPLFAEGGQLAIWISVFFWSILMIEILMLYRYWLAAYCASQIAFRRFRQRIEQRLRRYRILQVCREARSRPRIEDESTIVYEMTELDDLAMAALRIARDQHPAKSVATAKLRSSTGASKGQTSQALQQLEKLQFIRREQNKRLCAKSYTLTTTGHMYLKACEG
jgi:DNA-binding MarR family transcriptional regulator